MSEPTRESDKARIRELEHALGKAVELLERNGIDRPDLAAVLDPVARHALCAEGHECGWTFDFQTKKVYCRQCEQEQK